MAEGKTITILQKGRGDFFLTDHVFGKITSDYRGIVSDDGLSVNLAVTANTSNVTWDLMKSPDPGYVASFSITPNGDTCRYVFASNIFFKPTNFIIKCTENSTKQNISVDYVIGRRTNGIRCIDRAGGAPYIFSWVQLNKSKGYPHGFVSNVGNFDSLATRVIRSGDYETGGSLVPGEPFDSNTDRYDTDRRFYVYRFNTETAEISDEQVFTTNSITQIVLR